MAGRAAAGGGRARAALGPGRGDVGGARAGHGGRSGRYAAWEQIAWEWAFVLDRLGATERVDGLETLSG